MSRMTDHQKKVQQALEGNERVWFHPFEDKIAVWHGGPQVTIVNSRTWEEVEVLNVRVWDRDLSEVETAVKLKLTGRGFDRQGRAHKSTTVTEA